MHQLSVSARRIWSDSTCGGLLLARGTPIEVKSGKNYTLSSLTKCMKRFGEHMTTPTVLHAADYKEEDNITYLPHYMTPLL